MESTCAPSDLSPAIPSVGVGGLVFDNEGRVLLVRRKRPPQAGLWHIPGGRLEPGETLAECCRREVREETGIEVAPSHILAVADRTIEGFHYIIIDFIAQLTSQSPRQPSPSSDAADARWIHPDNLGEYSLVAGLEAVIRAGQSSPAKTLPTGLHSDAEYSWLFTSVNCGNQRILETCALKPGLTRD